MSEPAQADANTAPQPLTSLSLRPAPDDIAGAGRLHLRGTPEQRRAHARAMAARRTALTVLGKMLVEAADRAGYVLTPKDGGDGD